MTITKWDPFRELNELQDRLATFFGRTPARLENGEMETITLADWTPMVDVTEDEKEYLVTADLPGVPKEGVKVTVENGTLSITGERKTEKKENGRKYHRVERTYGSFLRTFVLPEGSDGEKVSAEFKEGVLKVHLPKSKTAKTKSIAVQVA